MADYCPLHNYYKFGENSGSITITGVQDEQIEEHILIINWEASNYFGLTHLLNYCFR
jgi:hypothetical protein